jgi:hypothetical protein
VIKYGVFIFVQLNPADSDGHYFCAGNFDGLSGFIEGFIFAGSYNQP